MRNGDERLYDILKEDTMIPSKVERKIQDTYTEIESGRASRKEGAAYEAPKRRFRTAAAVAVTVLALGTTAYAAARHSAILDSFAKYDSGRELPEQAKALIETDIAQEKAQDGVVNFKVREALCDKNNIVAAVEAKAADMEKYLIVPEDLQSEEDWKLMTMENLNPSMAEKDMKIADYAKKYNKEILPVGVSIDTGSAICSIDFNLEEDGTAVFTCQSENVGKKAEMDLSCHTAVFYKGDIVKDAFEFKVHDNSKADKEIVYRAEGGQTVEGTNLVVDEVRFENSAIGIKSTITYHYAGDPERITENDEDTGFFFFGQNGKQLKDGVGMAGGCTNKNGIFTQTGSLALTELPEQLTLQAKNVMTKEKFGSIKINRVDK